MKSRFTDSPVLGSASPQFVRDRAGLLVDVSGTVWRLNDPTKRVVLDWDTVGIPRRDVLDATREYFLYLIKNYSAGEVQGNWYGLRFIWSAPSLLEACANGDQVPYRAFSEARSRTTREDQYRLHYVRKWYRWCCDQGFPSFSAEVAFALDEVVIGGNPKGHSVLSADPESGPLVDTEIVALNNALRAARLDDRLSLKEQAALWLCIALGSNPGQLALLREEDFRKVVADGSEAVFCEIDVPRLKKGYAKRRTAFKTRKLTREIGEVIESLIAENRVSRNPDVDAACARPLFRRDEPRYFEGDPLQEYSFHYRSTEFTDLVRRAVKVLNVVSPRTHRPLVVTTRRLRYTFASRLVREGASQRAVAEALDHTDLQNVQVYFDIKSDMVDKLDAAMALELGPLSQAFLGQIVRSEGEAVRGDRPSSRVYHADRRRQSLDAIGTCGSFSFCGLTAPIACYTCIRFQPWIDAPHEQVLDSLLAERQRRRDGDLDGKMVTLFDSTILAVADVIKRIEGIREATAHGR